jgi:N,N'-diacetyllegionaminate synthase
MATLRKSFGIKTGYSDHTLGMEASIAAVALGASVIEKHFTLAKNMRGPDHKASLEPKEFKNMVLAIRNIEKALGSSIKKPTPSELKNREIVRKSIVAAKDIKKGDIFNESNITAKRCSRGLSPMLWNKISGHVAKRDFKQDKAIVL